jgi:hypothetical protein
MTTDLGIGRLEQEAVAIISFSMYYVPALLQMAEYARDYPEHRPADGSQVIDQRVEARILRQQLLDRETPPCYRVRCWMKPCCIGRSAARREYARSSTRSAGISWAGSVAGTSTTWSDSALRQHPGHGPPTPGRPRQYAD